MIRRHLTPAVVLFSALLLTCFLIPASSRSWWIPLAPATVCSAAALVLLGSISAAARRGGALALSLSLGLFLGAVSLARMAFSMESAFLPVPTGEVSGFTGGLTRDSTLSRNGDSVLPVALREVTSSGRMLAESARGGVLVLLSGDYRFSMGEVLSFRAGLKSFDPQGPERFVAHVDRKDLRRSGYSAGAWEWRASARDWLHAAVARAGYPASALMEALLIGVREDVPESLYNGFQRTGSLHILALSGLHVTVIYGLLSFPLGFLRGRVVKFLLATAVLLFYQFLAGFMPSLLRATVMIVVGGMALLLDRDAEPLNLLAISGIGIVLVDPFQAFSLSFQLSYLALLGMLVLGPLFRRPLEGRVPRFLLSALAVSMGAQAATLPLVIARFGVYYPSGLVASLILVPLTTVFLWAGLAWLAIFAVPWPWLHDLCSHAFAALYAVIEMSARVLSRLPGIGFPPGFVPWAVGASFAALLCLGTVLPARVRSPLLKAPPAGDGR